MSKYDIEVEARLTALEKAIADLAVKCEENLSGSDERVICIIGLTLNIGRLHKLLFFCIIHTITIVLL